MEINLRDNCISRKEVRANLFAWLTNVFKVRTHALDIISDPVL